MDRFVRGLIASCCEGWPYLRYQLRTALTTTALLSYHVVVAIYSFAYSCTALLLGWIDLWVVGGWWVSGGCSGWCLAGWWPLPGMG